VKLKIPGDVGVPEIVFPLRLRPRGSIPDGMDQVYGEVPPAAASCAVYEFSSTPGGSDPVEMANGNARVEAVSVKVGHGGL